MIISAPYESEFRKFKELSHGGKYLEAFDIFLDSPGILFWMDSTDIAWNVASALKERLDVSKAMSLYDSGKEFSRNLGRIAQVNGLGTLVERCQFASDEKDETTYWKQYNKFLTQVKAGTIHTIPVDTFVYSYLPLGISARAYAILKGQEQSTFERLVQENMDGAQETILTDALLSVVVKLDDDRGLPPNLWNI